MKYHLILASIFIALAGCCITAPPRQATLRPRTVTFASDPVGQMPAGFSTALTGGGGPVAWAVRADPTAPFGKILVQESTDDTSYRFPMCIHDAGEARDVAVEVRFKALAGKVNQAGGIVLRYAPENYYVARANALEDNIDLFKTVNGNRLKIEEVPMKVTPGQWHTLRFEADGSRLKVTFDGKVAVEKDDTTFMRPGKVGLWTKADSVSAFAEMKIEKVGRR